MAVATSVFPHRSERRIPIRAAHGEIQRGKSLRELSTWGIGGHAKLYAEAHSESDMISCISYCCKRNIRFLVLGRGSNCLFDDRGFDGCIILNRICTLEENGAGLFRAGSGFHFSLLGLHTARSNFTGLEFASGIPGTVGGAVFMNAGAGGQETASVLKSVDFVDIYGGRRTFCKERDELLYHYRRSPFQKMQDLGAIVGATFELQPCEEANDRLKQYLSRRKQTQPLKEKSAGCVFRNPGEGCCHSAGALIEKAGLKGVRIGGAKVSELHANFIVNEAGNATSQDVISLIGLVKAQVCAQFQVELQEEIRYIPFN